MRVNSVKLDEKKSNLVQVWLMRLLYGFIGLVAIYALGRFIDVSLGSYYGGIRAPYLQMLGPNQATIHWQDNDSEPGVVRYGLDLRNLNDSATDSKLTNSHAVTLFELQPATRYYYSVGTKEKVFRGGTKEDWFITAPRVADTSKVRFWVLGDPGDWTRGIFEVRDSALQWLKNNKRGLNSDSYYPDLDFIVTTGDNAYKSGSNKQFQKAVFEPFADVLKNVNYWPAYGNHDARRWAFFDIFSFPTNGELGGIPSNTENYYSFDYANIHFVFLDTPKADLSPDGSMLTWLRRDLRKTKQQWLIAVFHYPPYTKGSHDSDSKSDSSGRLIKVRENVIPLLEQYGVDLVLTGHSHLYERSYLIGCHYGDSASFQETMKIDNGMGYYNKPYYKYSNKLAPNEGAVYAVIGSSSKVDGGLGNHPAHAVSIFEHGSLIVDVEGDRLDARFINDKMQVLDNFSIIKGHDTAKKIKLPCQTIN